MRRTAKQLILSCCLPFLARAQVFNRSDLNWTLPNENGSIPVPGSLPSQAHIYLFKTGYTERRSHAVNQFQSYTTFKTGCGSIPANVTTKCLTYEYPNVRRKIDDNKLAAFLPSRVYKVGYLVRLSESVTLFGSPGDPTYLCHPNAILLDETSADTFKYDQNGLTIVSDTLGNIIHWVLESAVQSSQNMLRMWGGGIYQSSSDVTTDGDLGILDWSELIFSDTLYSIYSFIESVEPEVRQSVLRVNRHFRNVQWACGNEVEGIIMSANMSLANGTHTLSEQGRVMHDAISMQDGNVLERYNYDATEAFNLSTYPAGVTRCFLPHNLSLMNEFIFQSMPSFHTWKEVLKNPEDIAFSSTVVIDVPRPSPPSWKPRLAEPQCASRAVLDDECCRALVSGTSGSNQTFAQWCWSTQVFPIHEHGRRYCLVRTRRWDRPEQYLDSPIWRRHDIWQVDRWTAIE
ncbi:hypothetical protein L210DRAFT_3502328 [Boletus edulis BED1]|uniref:Uncharacterized protein n=1 Tax=Boletus edulis BED1 TaxID=1328754 RepID=A0AAD4C187_BOLED|nr:hypothetical protein L210DRAFT_3502328 [Boletus edulis BED1]